MERNSSAYIDMFVFVGLKVLDPNAICGYVLRLDCTFCFGSSSIIIAYPAAVKLAPDMTIFRKANLRIFETFVQIGEGFYQICGYLDMGGYLKEFEEWW